MFKRVGCLHACMRRSVRLCSRSEKFIILQCSLYTISIYKPHVRQSAIYARRAFDADCGLQARRSILGRGTAKSSGICCGWRARGDVTSHAVTASVGWPEARGDPCEARGIGLRGYSGACRGARLSKRACTLCGKLRRQSREHPTSVQGERPRTPEPYVERRESRERPSSLWISERQDQDSCSREHPC